MHKDETHRNLITLTMEDDTQIELQPLVTIGVKDKEYLALTPPSDECEDVYFYEFVQHGEHDIELLNIDDDEILDAVLDEFEKWFDEQIEKEERKQEEL